MSGTKHDDGKPRMDLVPPLALLEVGHVMRYGAEKYSAHNWRAGIDGSRYVAAVRHLLAYNSGENTDAESGLPPLAHAVACCLMLMETDASRDDRWRPVASAE